VRLIKDTGELALRNLASARLRASAWIEFCGIDQLIKFRELHQLKPP
jgi:hypothetical protein